MVCGAVLLQEWYMLAAQRSVKSTYVTTTTVVDLGIALARRMKYSAAFLFSGKDLQMCAGQMILKLRENDCKRDQAMYAMNVRTAYQEGRIIHCTARRKVKCVGCEQES